MILIHNQAHKTIEKATLQRKRGAKIFLKIENEISTLYHRPLIINWSQTVVVVITSQCDRSRWHTCGHAVLGGHKNTLPLDQ